MDKMKIILNKEFNTLDIWFDDPSKEAMSEETGEEIILKKDKAGRVIGIEKLNALPSPSKSSKKKPFEVIVE